MASVQTPPKRWDTMELVKGILPTAIGNKRDTGDSDAEGTIRIARRNLLKYAVLYNFAKGTKLG